MALLTTPTRPGPRASGGGVVIDTRDRRATVLAATPVNALRHAAAAAGLDYPHRPAAPDLTVGAQLRQARYGFPWLDSGSPLARIVDAGTVHADGARRVIDRDARLGTVRRSLDAVIAAGGQLTEVTLELDAAPAHRISIIATFDERVAAGRAAEAIIALCRPRTLNVVDEAALAVAAGHGEITCYAPGAAVLVELGGSDLAAVRRDADELWAVCRRTGATSVRARADADIAAAVDELATHCLPALHHAGFTAVGTVAVPVSGLAGFVADLELIERLAGVRMTVLIDGATAAVSVLAPPSASTSTVTLARHGIDLLDHGQRVLAG